MSAILLMLKQRENQLLRDRNELLVLQEEYDRKSKPVKELKERIQSLEGSIFSQQSEIDIMKNESKEALRKEGKAKRKHRKTPEADKLVEEVIDKVYDIPINPEDYNELAEQMDNTLKNLLDGKQRSLAEIGFSFKTNLGRITNKILGEETVNDRFLKISLGKDTKEDIFERLERKFVKEVDSMIEKKVLYPMKKEVVSSESKVDELIRVIDIMDDTGLYTTYRADLEVELSANNQKVRSNVEQKNEFGDFSIRGVDLRVGGGGMDLEATPSYRFQFRLIEGVEEEKDPIKVLRERIIKDRASLEKKLKFIDPPEEFRKFMEQRSEKKKIKAPVNLEMKTKVELLKMLREILNKKGKSMSNLDKKKKAEIIALINDNKEEEGGKEIILEFSTEAGGISGADGLEGFVNPLVSKYQKEIGNMKTIATKIAKETLKKLFPTATKIDSLVLSAFVSPAQFDGGIRIYQQGKTVKGELIYDEVTNADRAKVESIVRDLID